MNEIQLIAQDYVLEPGPDVSTIKNDYIFYFIFFLISLFISIILTITFLKSLYFPV